jgi:hypothetical protein
MEGSAVYVCPQCRLTTGVVLPMSFATEFRVWYFRCATCGFVWTEYKTDRFDLEPPPSKNLPS